MGCGRFFPGFAFYAGVAALALFFAGCGPRSGPDGKTLLVGNGAEVQDLDPHLVSGVTEHRVLSSLFEGLADLDPATMEPVPAAAESWEVSEDGRVYTFHLRRNGRWSNGDPVTARDFAYAWQRILTPSLAAEYAYMLHCIKNAKAFNEGTLDDFSKVGVRVLDDYVLEVTLEHPTPYFLGMQTHQTWYPVHQATIERFGAMDERNTLWTREENFVGNGPFQLKEWWPEVRIRVVRNPHYWGAGAVRLEAIEFFPIDNEQTEEWNFRAGMLHLTGSVPLSKIPKYRAEHPDLLKIHPYCGTYYYRANVTRPPMDDKRVRRAFAMAINRKELIENVTRGGEGLAFNLTPPGTAGYTFVGGVEEDVEAARALLAEAGYPEGKGLPPIEILYNTSEAHKVIAEALQRMWKVNLGADVRLMNQDWKVYLSSMNTLDYGLARSAWIADFLDPVNFLECFITGGGNNRTGFSSPEYDTLIAGAYQEPDPERRFDLLQQAETILVEEAPIIPIYFYTWKFLQSPKVKGFMPNILGYIRWKDLYLETGEG